MNEVVEQRYVPIPHSEFLEDGVRLDVVLLQDLFESGLSENVNLSIFLVPNLQINK